MQPQADLLEERLIDFAAGVCIMLSRLPGGVVGTHISRQLVRSVTSPAANYAEARGAESRRDFVHKMQICLKELRETLVWLRLVNRVFRNRTDSRQIQECDELIAIFVRSIKTAKANQSLRPDKS